MTIALQLRFTLSLCVFRLCIIFRVEFIKSCLIVFRSLARKTIDLPVIIFTIHFRVIDNYGELYNDVELLITYLVSN